VRKPFHQALKKALENKKDIPGRSPATLKTSPGKIMKTEK